MKPETSMKAKEDMLKSFIGDMDKMTMNRVKPLLTISIGVPEEEKEEEDNKKKPE